MPQADPHLGVAKELLLRSRGRGVVCWAGRAFRAGKAFVCHGCGGAFDLRRGYEASFPPNQVNDSNKGSNGPAGSRSGKLHSEERDGLSVTGRSPASPESNEGPPGYSQSSE